MKIRSKNRGGKPDLLTLGQILEMIRHRVFPRDARIELLRGILIEHPKRSPEHDDSVGALGDELRKSLPLPWFVSEEKDLEFGQTTRVGPDIALIRGHLRGEEPWAFPQV